MEAIDQNPVVYNLFSEVAWHSEALNMTTWIPQYATRRYGANSPNALLGRSIVLSLCFYSYRNVYFSLGAAFRLLLWSSVVCRGHVRARPSSWHDRRDRSERHWSPCRFEVTLPFLIHSMSCPPVERCRVL